MKQHTRRSTMSCQHCRECSPHEARKAGVKPIIHKLAQNNTRKGFFERHQFEEVLKHLPDDIKPVAWVAYITGWRIHDEILTGQRLHVDMKAGWLRLEPGTTAILTGQHYCLITRSALTNTFGVIVRPICLAVFSLMTNSNFVGCPTRRSAGFVPFRILSTSKEPV